MLAPFINLRCFPIIVRSLGLGTLFVMIDILLEQERMNLACRVSLMFFRRVLI